MRLLSSQLQQTKWTEDGWPTLESDLSGTTVHLHRCRLLRTLHHQGRSQGSKTIRRSIHVFSQSSSPYWGGKFSWIKFIYSSTPALHSPPWSCQRNEEYQWHELGRCTERVAPSHRRNGSRRDSSQITERKHWLDLQSTRRQPHGWRMGATDQDHKESSFWLNGRIWPLLGWGIVPNTHVWSGGNY